MKTRLVRAEVSHADRETDTAFTKLVVALRNCFSNAPNKDAHIFLLLVKEKKVGFFNQEKKNVRILARRV